MLRNDTELISIIVPVYNCLPFLDKCILSICNQDYTNIEIILVDDGSDDGSGSLCDEWKRKDERIVVIHKKNGGQLDARAAGIRAARGEYLGFVDADDWIDKEMYSSLLRQIGDCDLISSGIYNYGEDNSIQSRVFDGFRPGTYETSDDFFIDNLIVLPRDKMNPIGGIGNSMYSKLFKKNIALDIIDETNIGIKNGEDLFFVLCYALKCKKVRIIDEIHYHHVYNYKSVTHSIMAETYLPDRFNFFYSFLMAIDSHPARESLKLQLQRYIIYIISNEVPYMMDVDWGAMPPMYFFSGYKSMTGKQIIIFGAGRIGQDYLKHLNKICEIVMWVDNNPHDDLTLLNIKVVKPIEINNCQSFDYVVCATMKDSSAKSMREQLGDMGIESSKILWEKPCNLLLDYIRGEY